MVGLGFHWPNAGMIHGLEHTLGYNPLRFAFYAKATGAIPYDVPDVELSHVGPLCSFDAFLKRFHLRDPALAQLALVVRGADTARLDLAPQAAGPARQLRQP